MPPEFESRTEGAEERSPTLSCSRGAETPPGWSRVCILCDRSADAMISGRARQRFCRVVTASAIRNALPVERRECHGMA